MKTMIYRDDLDLDIEFDYQPEEAAVMYYGDGSGYPGCSEQMDICLISHDGYDITEYFEDDMEAIEELVYENLHEDCRDF